MSCQGNCNGLNDPVAYNSCVSCGGGQIWTALYMIGHVMSCQ
jgi:hypothetical protein